MSELAQSPPALGAPLAPSRRRVLPIAAAGLLAALALAALFAPLLFTGDPLALDPLRRLRPPGASHWLGTDQFGRDIWTLVLYGARASLFVGLAVSLLAIGCGLLLGLVAGYVRLLDALIMRLMDALMAIPGLLLAIALVAVSGASVTTVVVAITIPEVPRVVRLVRSVTLSVRDEPYVAAAIALGGTLPAILGRHVLPNVVPPLIVLGSYVCASAMLTEAILSFLGAGTPPEIPSWGGMMAGGRLLFPIAPGIVLYPGIALAATILAVNVLGDALRDRLDPFVAKRLR